MQKWSCSRCGRIMTQITNCNDCTASEVHDLVSAVKVELAHEEVMPSRVTEVLDSSQFVRSKHQEDNLEIDQEISESAIECKEEEMAFFDSHASQKGDIFEETSLNDDVEATMLLHTEKTKEPTTPTVFIPTDSEIRKAFGEKPINATDETFVQPATHYNQPKDGFSSHLQKTPSLPNVDGSALASTREQEEGPSRFQRSDVIGGTFGRCRVVEKISEGAMGRVYKAYHQTLDKTVVLKELPPSLASSQELRERFIREAKACAKIHHQNVVQVLDAGYENGIYFYIMEYVDGLTVEELLKAKKKISIEKSCSIIIDAAKGLGVAHQQGVVHRDIKASNIMVTKDEQVKVADFGLACDLGNSKISVAGQIMGTPQYMSPEQWDGANNVDARSDLYSLGITFYYMLAERLPFDSGSTVTLFKQHVSEKPPSLKTVNPDVPAALVKIVNKLMHKDRDKRYENAESFVKDLEEFLRDKHKKSAAYHKVAMVGLFMIFAAGAAYAHFQGYSQQVFDYFQSQERKEKIANQTSNAQTQTNKNNTTIKIKNNNETVKNNTEENNGTKNNAEENNGTKNNAEENNGTKNNTEENNGTKNNTEENNDTKNNTEENNETKNQTNEQNTNSSQDIKNVEDPIISDENEQKKEVVKIPKEKPVILPRVQIKMKKRILNKPTVVVYGKISSALPTKTQVVLLIQKGNRLYKKHPVRVKRNKFVSKMNLKDGKYQIIPQVVHHKQQKKRIGRVISFVIDSKPPVIKLISPNQQQIFYEEQIGSAANIRVKIKDFLKIAKAFVYHKQRKIPLNKQGDDYVCTVNLQYGKQSLYVVGYDQAGNMQKMPLTWALVPRNMVRIPEGRITLHGQVVSFSTFYVDKKEISNDKYARYLQSSGAKAPLRWKPKQQDSWRNKPVVFVSYEEATNYSNFYKKRLLSEAEWVAAALWNKKVLRKYPWGENGDVSWPKKIKEVANWPQDVSFFGIHDMAGNVSEWVKNTEKDKAMRKGGNFILNSKYLKRMLWDQVRFMEPKSSRKNWLGFRCAFSE
ncbi:protein kinase [Candidatus Uabimicrobium sp. HlEnr_7]|uniref:protein kinase domain-containing protein n=1 Tax=Candidatus Uabimicrobium helgolandensis TaxID=3095367 RepID=UPI0035562FA6